MSAEYTDEFYEVVDGKVYAVYMTYGQFWKLKDKQLNLFEDYSEAELNKEYF